ncbi:MAG: type II CRISPR-associated endonuclease Cas1 [Paludibacteraceae bacterium]|nr:type II CRISPR-associated endonuclease Cas1 [Paludibacteraceae bacterium]
MIKRVIGFQNPAYLSLKLQQMVITLPDIEKQPNISEEVKKAHVQTIPIEDIGVVVLDNQQVTITQALMAALLENNVAIITCNSQHLPIGLHLCLDSNNLQNERFRVQLDASEPLKKQLWQQTIACKIAGQAAVLQSEQIVATNMLAWSKQVRSGDADNLEGRAAAYYWKNIFHNPDFIRAQDGLPPNNLLNYGYSIVRAMMARALMAAGLLPTLGIHHHSRYDAYCLADDIMEPYRPYVDSKVLEIWEQTADISELTPALKRELLALSTIDVLIDGHRSPMMIAMQTTANSVQRCFSGEIRKIIYPDW